jgi:hypothetical protein
MMLTWFRQIDDARSVTEVVAIARDYVATWGPDEIVRLPRSVRPGRIRDAFDVTDLHARLADEYRITRASGDELTALQRLTGFMVHASVRISQLGGSAEGEDKNVRVDAAKSTTPGRD